MFFIGGAGNGSKDLDGGQIRSVLAAEAVWECS